MKSIAATKAAKAAQVDNLTKHPVGQRGLRDFFMKCLQNVHQLSGAAMYNIKKGGEYMTTRRILALLMVLVMVALSTSTVFARGRGHHGGGHHGHGAVMAGQAANVQVFNEQGFLVNSWCGRLWQDTYGYATFGQCCWYLDADGNITSAWGLQAFDEDGVVIPWENHMQGQGLGLGLGCRGRGLGRGLGGCWRWQ
jgi:hypothetical protein